MFVSEDEVILNTTYADQIKVESNVLAGATVAKADFDLSRWWMRIAIFRLIGFRLTNLRNVHFDINYPRKYS